MTLALVSAKHLTPGTLILGHNFAVVNTDFKVFDDAMYSQLLIVLLNSV